MAEPAAPAAPAPAPAAAAPAAAAPAPAAVAPAAPAPAAAAPSNLIADGKVAAPAAATVDVMKAFLTEKGAKAEDLAALDEAALRAKYEEANKPAPKPGEAKPEDFAVKVPEGRTVDEALLKSLQDTLADANLSPAERAQKLFDMHDKAMMEATEGPTKLWLKTQTDWQATVKADAELGGANFDAVSSTIAKALDSIGGTEAQKIRDAFIFTGAGNNPEIVRIMYRMSKALVEGGAISGEPPNKLTGDAAADAALTKMYPSASKVR